MNLRKHQQFKDFQGEGEQHAARLFLQLRMRHRRNIEREPSVYRCKQCCYISCYYSLSTCFIAALQFRSKLCLVNLNIVNSYTCFQIKITIFYAYQSSKLTRTLLVFNKKLYFTVCSSRKLVHFGCTVRHDGNRSTELNNLKLFHTYFSVNFLGVSLIIFKCGCDYKKEQALNFNLVGQSKKTDLYFFINWETYRLFFQSP